MTINSRMIRKPRAKTANSDKHFSRVLVWITFLSYVTKREENKSVVFLTYHTAIADTVPVWASAKTSCPNNSVCDFFLFVIYYLSLFFFCICYLCFLFFKFFFVFNIFFFLLCLFVVLRNSEFVHQERRGNRVSRHDSLFISA